MHIEGGCHCGQITFTAEIDPSRVMVCHCTDCQVMSGAPFRAVIPTPVEQFQLVGEPKRYVKVAESGNRRVQAFCGDCGTPLFATSAENPSVVIIRAGCVKQRAELAPQGQLWRRSALPWIEKLGSVPARATQ